MEGFVNPILEKQISKLKESSNSVLLCDDKLLSLISSTYDIFQGNEIVVKNDYDRLIAEYQDLKKSIDAEELFNLRNLKDKYESFYENSADAFICMNRHKFLFCNSAALNILGLASKDELRSFGLLDLSPEFQLNGSCSKTLNDEYMEKAFAGQINRFEWFFSRINGEKFIAEIIVKAAKFEGEDALYATIRDISANKKIGNKLLCKEITEEDDNKKNEFLINFSRDMRTSLNSVLGFAEILRDVTLDAKHSEALANIRLSSGILLNLVNEISLLAVLMSGKAVVNAMSNNLQKALESIVADCNKFFQGSNVFFEYVSDLHIAFYEFDDDFLKKIITNLISNAAKFTIKGAVRFKVLVIEDNLEDSVIRFEVTDTGIGIPSEQKRKIFEPFYQIENRFIENAHGYGIGLFFVKMLVEIMGGEINVESEIGKGARFWFSLRFNKSEEILSNLEVKQREEKFDFSGKRILVVEDNKINQLLTKSFLDKVYASYVVADNGKIAIEKLQQEDFDLILMDVHMPVMDGIEATQCIRKIADSKKSTVPILALTANVMENDINSYKSVGMNEYLAKPIDSKKFYRALNTRLNRK